MKVKTGKLEHIRPCRCGSWFEHWKKQSGKSVPALCPEIMCSNAPEVGVYVQKIQSTGTNDTVEDPWYVIPVCSRHSTRTESVMIVDEQLILVPVEGGTCQYGA